MYNSPSPDVVCMCNIYACLYTTASVRTYTGVRRRIKDFDGTAHNGKCVDHLLLHLFFFLFIALLAAAAAGCVIFISGSCRIVHLLIYEEVEVDHSALILMCRRL
jgi:hypothetical protein